MMEWRMDVSRFDPTRREHLKVPAWQSCLARGAGQVWDGDSMLTLFAS